jgi:hypothetical protein
MKKLACGRLCNAWPIFASLCLLSAAACVCATPPSSNSPPRAVDYEQPKLLAGNIFALQPDGRKLLFKSKRTTARSGAVVTVTIEYTYPDGTPAARSRIVYEAGRLQAYELDELQTGDHGRAVFALDPENAGRRRILFDYAKTHNGETRKSNATESLQKDTLVDDMIPDFIVDHWDALMSGAAVKFRFIALSRKETVGFELVKESETTRGSEAMVRVKMEPTSLIIAHLVDPLFFVVEKNGSHRVREYIGRTTPMVKNGAKWKDLDGDTVFDWPAAGGTLSVQR